MKMIRPDGQYRGSQGVHGRKDEEGEAEEWSESKYRALG